MPPVLPGSRYLAASSTQRPEPVPRHLSASGGSEEAGGAGRRSRCQQHRSLCGSAAPAQAHPHPRGPAVLWPGVVNPEPQPDSPTPPAYTSPAPLRPAGTGQPRRNGHNARPGKTSAMENCRETFPAGQRLLPTASRSPRPSLLRSPPSSGGGRLPPPAPSLPPGFPAKHTVWRWRGSARRSAPALVPPLAGPLPLPTLRQQEEVRETKWPALTPTGPRSVPAAPRSRGAARGGSAVPSARPARSGAALPAAAQPADPPLPA